MGELYEGAVRILFELRPPGYTRFVAHAVREIGNGLPFVIFGIRSSSRLDYTNLLDWIAEQWKRAGFATDGTLAGLEPILNSDGSRAKAVECLALIVEGDKDGWAVLSWREHARNLLGGAIHSADQTARMRAINLVHYLGARGYSEFRDLIPANVAG